MSYFLDGPEQAPRPQIDQPATGVPNFLQGLRAGISTAQIETDANFNARRTASEVRMDTLGTVWDRLGHDSILERLKEKGMASPLMEEIRPDLLRNNSRAQNEVLEMAREASAANPEAWSDVDVSDEGITSEVDGRLRQEFEEAQQILEMMPSGRGSAEVVGGIVGLTADVRNVPFLLAGGGSGSFLRIMGREAMLNMAAESVTLPQQFEMAERLDIPDPDIRTQLALAAVGGAVLGGVLEGASRGVTYWRQRNQPPKLPGYDRTGAQDAVDAVETALASNSPRPFEAAVRASEGAAPPAPAPRLELSEEMRVPQEPDTVRVYHRGEQPTPGETREFTSLREALEGDERKPTWFVDLERNRELLEETAPDAEVRAEIDPDQYGGARLLEEAVEEGEPPKGVKVEDLKTAPDRVESPSWVIRNRETGEAVLETFNPRTVDRINTEKYEAVPTLQHLQEINDPNSRAGAHARRPDQSPTARNPSQELSVPESQRELFDAPGSDRTAAFHDNVTADIRDRIEEDDFKVDMGDGRGERPVSSVLDEIEKGEEFAEQLKLCGAPRVSE